MPTTLDMDTEHGFLSLFTYTLNTEDTMEGNELQSRFGGCQSTSLSFALYIKMKTTYMLDLPPRLPQQQIVNRLLNLESQPLIKKSTGLVGFQNKNKLIDLLIQSAIQRLRTVRLSMKAVGFI